MDPVDQADYQSKEEALYQAREALNTLDLNDVRSLKSFLKPP